MLKSTIATSLLASFSSEHSCETYSQSLAAVIPASLPDERDYCNDVHMATVRSASALLLHLFDCLKEYHSVESVTDTLSLLQPVSVIMLLACPVSCYDLLVTYLQNSAAAKASVLTTTEFVESCQFCSLLPDIVVEPIRAVASHLNIAKLAEMTKPSQPMSGWLLLVSYILFYSTFT